MARSDSLPQINLGVQGGTQGGSPQGDNTIWIGSTPISRENIRRWSGASHLSSPSTNLTRGLAARWLFRVLPCHKDTIHLQTSIIYLGFEPRSYNTAVSITNY
ncbi:hypothetical protein TNCV_2134701 [Trichonephila clavipes]|nr:hypothetical protein TNCV_2134701 [Trichonephila clavipes]